MKDNERKGVEMFRGLTKSEKADFDLYLRGETPQTLPRQVSELPTSQEVKEISYFSDLVYKNTSKARFNEAKSVFGAYRRCIEFPKDPSDPNGGIRVTVEPQQIDGRVGEIIPENSQKINKDFAAIYLMLVNISCVRKELINRLKDAEEIKDPKKEEEFTRLSSEMYLQAILFIGWMRRRRMLEDPINQEIAQGINNLYQAKSR